MTKLHAKAISKPGSADTSDVQNTLDLFAFIRNLMGLLNTFLANSPKTQASS
ncbi:MAG TPA: hypothetical protein PLM14_05730 [Candidatus Hydrogenedentes bacterium]|nr:hypothetical protein [Candidatus Hydrogenedentota bacterium]HQE82480.1 hypothetical protein [Candidatus Hydrogenedentota bacterium]HQH50778.1 hypothetical protein [Candidatus Hydrogenedentota bacterium]HQM47716.1 hypothetical protein [Candidatus Hydrogenedentota bacterium]